MVPEEVKGELEFHQVYFRYPLRPRVPVFSGLDLKIQAGKVMALVGESGSGKSTVISLIERFYDPLGGRITLDGIDVRSLTLESYRACIGLVGQEPALFEGTIGENIRYGRRGATQEEVESAARAANIHTFIANNLPDGCVLPRAAAPCPE